MSDLIDAKPTKPKRARVVLPRASPEIASFALHHGDCLAGMAGMADGSVDVVITDPPYSEHVHSKGRTTPRRNDPSKTREGRNLGFDSISAGDMRTCAGEFARLARRWVVVFCDVESTHLWRREMETAGLRHARTGFWIKTDPQPQITGDRPGSAAEGIVIAHTGATGRWRWNGGGRPAIYIGPIEKVDRFHTSQKPEWLLEALTRDFTDPGEIILDSHAGSGTTGVAAIRHGRRFIGWERDAKYHAAALSRLSQTREQLGLFTASGSGR